MSTADLKRSLVRDGTTPLPLDAPRVDGNPELTRWTQKVAALLNEKLGDSGATAERLLRVRDLLDLGAVAIRGADGNFVKGSGTPPRDMKWLAAAASDVDGGGAGIPGPAGPPGPPAPTPPPPAPPTVPTNLQASASLSSIILTWDAQDFAVVAYVEVWAAATNNLAVAAYIGNAYTNVYVDAVGATGVLKYYWIRSVGFGGDKSAYNATSGVAAQTGKIGTNDLSDLIIEAGKLADGAVTANKIAGGVIDATKFASAIAPMGVYSVLPNPATYTGPAVLYVVSEGKLYRYVNGAFTAAVPTTDLAGLLTSAQIDSLAASKITGQLTDAQIAALAAAKLTGQITTTQITDGAISTPKLAAGSVTTNELAAESVVASKIAANAITATQIAANAVTAAKIIAGAVTTEKILAGAVTTDKMQANSISGDRILANSLDASKIVANSITAGQIQAAAIGATQIAAGAIRAQHLLIAPKSLNTDPSFEAGSSVWSGFVRRLVRTDPAVPTGCPVQYAAEFNVRDGLHAARLDVVPGEQYRISAWVNPGAGGGGLGVGAVIIYYDADGVFITASVPYTAASGWTRVSGTYTVPANTARIAFGAWADRSTYTGEAWYADIALEKVNDASLIVDGAITATKLAANSIAVGTAAIQNGAIVNAMIGNAAIDDAKIANLDAGKITTGFINAARIAVGSIDARIAQIAEGQIANASITSAKIATGAITTAAIGDAQITTAKILDAQITAAKILDGQITTAKIADANITAAKIADGNITTAKIGNAQVTTAKIGDLQVSTLKLQNQAVIIPVASENITAYTGNGAWQTIGTIGITLPETVKLQVTAGCNMWHDPDLAGFALNGIWGLKLIANSTEILFGGPLYYALNYPSYNDIIGGGTQGSIQPYFSFGRQWTLGAGSHTFTLQFYGDTNVTAAYTFMHILGARNS